MSDHHIETCTRSGCDRVASVFWINGAYCPRHAPEAPASLQVEPTNYPPEVVAAYEQGRSDAALSLSELCLAFEDRSTTNQRIKQP